MYKTGDLVRRRPDGTIVFAGRIDGQVKIRGLRVELGEIETALVTHPAVAQAVVTVITDQSGEPQLAAYLRPAKGGPPDLAEIRQHLAGSLPGYMVPAYLTRWMSSRSPPTARWTGPRCPRRRPCRPPSGSPRPR